MKPGPIKSNRKILAWLFLLFSCGLRLSAQTVTSNDPDLELSSIKVSGDLSKWIRFTPWSNTVVAGEGTLWIRDNRRVYKLDPDSGRFLAAQVEDWSTGKGLKEGASFAVGAGSIWVYLKSHGVEGVHRYDPATGKCIAAIALTKKVTVPVLVYGAGALWALGSGKLQRIDPRSNQVTAATDLPKGSWWPGPVVADGFVWLLDVEKGLMRRFDSQSATLRDEFQAGPPQPGFFRMPFEGGMYRFTVGDGAIWVANDKHGTADTFVLTRFDSKTLEQIAKIESDRSYGQPVIWNGFVWFLTAGYAFDRISMRTNHSAGELLITSEGNRRETGELIRDEKSLWVISSRMITRIQPKKTDPDNQSLQFQ